MIDRMTYMLKGRNQTGTQADLRKVTGRWRILWLRLCGWAVVTPGMARLIAWAVYGRQEILKGAKGIEGLAGGEDDTAVTEVRELDHWTIDLPNTQLKSLFLPGRQLPDWLGPEILNQLKNSIVDKSVQDVTIELTVRGTFSKEKSDA